jgi:hypothetical protein
MVEPELPPFALTPVVPPCAVPVLPLELVLAPAVPPPCCALGLPALDAGFPVSGLSELQAASPTVVEAPVTTRT